VPAAGNRPARLHDEEVADLGQQHCLVGRGGNVLGVELALAATVLERLENAHDQDHRSGDDQEVQLLKSGLSAIAPTRRRMTFSPAMCGSLAKGA
jgi:hypothetical protein